LIAHWLAVISTGGSFTDRPTHFIDFLATFVDITGAEYPVESRGQKIIPLQGESFLPVLTAKESKRTKPLFWQWQLGKAVRRGDWKLVSHGNWELYNLKEDRSETRNRIKDSPEIASELQILYKKWAGDVGVSPR